tara:strand:- start:24820 stop:25125 length:306 start_codon:yes stop_codon:yes gene_type:complete
LIDRHIGCCNGGRWREWKIRTIENVGHRHELTKGAILRRRRRQCEIIVHRGERFQRFGRCQLFWPDDWQLANRGNSLRQVGQSPTCMRKNKLDIRKFRDAS